MDQLWCRQLPLILLKCLTKIIGDGMKKSGPGQLNRPNCVCVHSQGVGADVLLIVSNFGNNRIDLFELTYCRYLRSIGSSSVSGSDRRSVLMGPAAISVWTPQDDPTNVQLVVTSHRNHCIQFYRLSDGSFVRSVGEDGVRVGQISFPGAMSIHTPIGSGDDDALLLVVGYYDSRIHVYSLASGEYLRCLGGGKGEGVDQLGEGCSGIAFHRPVGEAEAATRIILSDSQNRRLQVFNVYSGAHICSIGGGDSGIFDSPGGIYMLCNDSDDQCEWNYVLK